MSTSGRFAPADAFCSHPAEPPHCPALIPKSRGCVQGVSSRLLGGRNQGAFDGSMRQVSRCCVNDGGAIRQEPKVSAARSGTRRWVSAINLSQHSEQ